ncbi:MAG: RsmE family RNA methyltransferase [Spirochaetales bacterium]|nr:RsmE family RNA methyltransferase [Spirochaetales bacterium]
MLRSRPGDELRVGVVNGPTGTATLRSIDRDGVVLDVRWSAAGPPSLDVHILLGHPRPPVLRRLWRDLASMRVASITAFIGILSERSYLKSSVWDDYGQALCEGMSQGAHTAPPTIRRAADLAAAIAETGDGRRRIVASPGGTTSLANLLEEIASARDTGPIHLCVGPERGFTVEEEALLLDDGFRAVALGSSVLRTETATILLSGAVCATLDRVGAGAS